MSSENYVRIIMAENLRNLWEGSSSIGKPGAKARPRGVVDAHAAYILQPSEMLSKGTLLREYVKALVAPGERD